MAPRILIVLTDAALRRALAFVLASAGYRVTTAGPATPFRLRGALHLIVADAPSPRADAAALWRRWHAIRRDIPMIVLRYPDRDDIAWAADDIGIVVAISRPVDPHELLACVHAILGWQRRPAQRHDSA